MKVDQFPSTPRITHIALILLTLCAFGLRLWRLDSVPPGWRDDELINSLVISQHTLDGDIRPYYADASGHEGLYHILNAIFLGIFGPSIPGIRWLSVLLGTLTIPLTYMVGRRLFGRTVGLAAAVALSLSFWSLMYSRIGLRHISLPVFALPTFYFFLQGVWQGRASHKLSYKPFILAGLFLSIGFYTYFASRGVPLILIAFAVYAALVDWPNFRRYWSGITLTLGIALLLAVPLIAALQAQPEAEARVAELAAPVTRAREGDFSLLGEHIGRTLSMFHSDGDDEFLYNIPFRPLFGPLNALFFWLGVAVALFYAFRPLVALFKKGWLSGQADPLALSAAFLLLWWLAGISPAFLSVPAASLSHTILAQPAVYILWALPLLSLWHWRKEAALITAVLLITLNAWRDLPAYFVEWPNRGNVRLLYRADIADVAAYAQAHQLTDFGVSSLLPGPWDRQAMLIYLAEQGYEARPRWYNSERVLLLRPSHHFFGYPVTLPILEKERYTTLDENIGGYQWGEVTMPPLVNEQPVACFVNGLCLHQAHFEPATGQLDLIWWVARPLDLPEMPLISNPPPPSVYAGPRLSVFAHLLNKDEQIITGDDGLWVDVLTLYPDDLFWQRHYLPPTAAPTAVRVGLYDPMTGERIFTESGEDSWLIEIPATGN